MAASTRRYDKDQCATHIGRVVSIDAGIVRVSIISQSACAGCHAKGSCGLHEQQEKMIDVPCNSSLYHVGDRVEVGVQKWAGMHAVFLSYVLPFVLVVATIFGLSSTGFDEGLSALVGLGCLVPYYLLLYAFRQRISRSFSFTITRKE